MQIYFPFLWLTILSFLLQPIFSCTTFTRSQYCMVLWSEKNTSTGCLHIKNITLKVVTNMSVVCINMSRRCSILACSSSDNVQWTKVILVPGFQTIQDIYIFGICFILISFFSTKKYCFVRIISLKSYSSKSIWVI